jgi:hypothetical protein
LARQEGETSNSLLDTLADWNTYLEQHAPSYRDTARCGTQTIADVAAKIGTGPRAVMEAEKGKPGTSAAVYVALLWAYDLLQDFELLGDPSRDEEGLALARQRERARARHAEGLDDDF